MLNVNVYLVEPGLRVIITYHLWENISVRTLSSGTSKDLGAAKGKKEMDFFFSDFRSPTELALRVYSFCYGVSKYWI